jgi:hypothetical protein
MEKSGAQGFVVVGVDGSDVSVQALRWAVDYAKLTAVAFQAIAELKAELDALRVQRAAPIRPGD